MQRSIIDGLPNTIENDRVLLSGIQDSDLNLICGFHNDPDISRFTPVDDYTSIDSLKAWYFSRYVPMHREKCYIISTNEKMQPIGYANVNLVGSDQVELGIAITNKFRNKGYGSSSIELISFSAFQAGTRKIIARVMVHNEPAVKLFNRNHFHQDGRLRQEIQHREEYYDVFLFSKLKSDS